jgi:hypothetical protein
VSSLPDFSTPPNLDLVRRIIEARNAYERLNGHAPTCLHVGGSTLLALNERGFKSGSQIAGMNIIARGGQPLDEAMCSRDEKLFEPVAVEKPTRKVKAK